MGERKLALAGLYADVLAFLRRGSPWRPHPACAHVVGLPLREPGHFLTPEKLKHDIEQFVYLQHAGVFGSELTPVIEAYRHVAADLDQRGLTGRVAFDKSMRDRIGGVYNRIIQQRHTPRVANPFSRTWNPAAVERRYLEPPGLVIVDDFLSQEALKAVRLYCLESTVWFANRYGHGRLGAFFQDGFNCPLLLQIAEDLRNALPNIIGERHGLRQLWGFKNDAFLPAGSTTHADFAAINVNFWITPEEANLDSESGGLTVYGIDAPPHWDFETYNGRSEVIAAYLSQTRARAIHIPYRQNRAIIFNSDLFHGTSGLKFRPGYENRRINITMLYGERGQDLHHQNRSPNDAVYEQATPAWRSAAFGLAG